MSRGIIERRKDAGKVAVEEVLRLRKILKVLKDRVADLEDTITDEDVNEVDIEMAMRDLPPAKMKLQKCQEDVRRKEAALGIDQRHALKQLVNSGYIQARMNARAVKFRLREKLRSRQFEMERVKGNFHCKKPTGR